MDYTAKNQRYSFLINTKNKMSRKLDEARAANIKSSDEIETFTATIAAIDLAIEANLK